MVIHVYAFSACLLPEVLFFFFFFDVMAHFWILGFLVAHLRELI